MRTRTYLTNLALLALISVVGVGCAKNGGSGFALTPTGNGGSVLPVTPPPTGTTTNTGTNQFNGQPGAAVAFKADSFAILNTYVGSHPLNNPQNLAMNVDLRDIGGGRFAGTIQIGYSDNGTWYNGYFETGSGTNQVSYQNIDTGKSVAEFNKWFTFEGKTVFHGFLQDRYGAVMLVIDRSLNLGDGGPSAYVGGSVYFKNFAPTYATQSSEKCWFIRVGPFDCRTFVIGDWTSGVIQTESALYPGNGYQRLGTFDGLDKARAFNQ
jgi:hypothetical protein